MLCGVRRRLWPAGACAEEEPIDDSSLANAAGHSVGWTPQTRTACEARHSMNPDPGPLSSHHRQLQLRLEALRNTVAYGAYERARDRFLVMKDLEAAGRADADAPSAYWREELEGISRLLT